MSIIVIIMDTVKIISESPPGPIQYISRKSEKGMHEPTAVESTRITIIVGTSCMCLADRKLVTHAASS